jgi:hypothetical protein
MQLVRFRSAASGLAAALCIAVAAPQAAASGPAEQPVLTVAGAGNTSTTWLLARTLTLNLDPLGGVVPHGGRSYSGVALHDSSGTLVTAAVHPQGFVLDGKPLLVRLGSRTSSVVLRPGRYTWTFLGDGPGRFEMPVRSGESHDIRVTTRGRAVSVSALRMDLGRDSAVASSARGVIAVPAGGTAGMFLYAAASNPGAQDSWMCLRPRGGRCDEVSSDVRGGGLNLSTEGKTTRLEGLTTGPIAKATTFDAGGGWRTVAVQAGAQGAFALAIGRA